MIFYTVFFVIYVVFYYMIGANKYKKNFNVYCIIMGLSVFLLFALRDISMGMNDVYDSYVPLFSVIKSSSMSDILSRVSDSYLFYILTKFISIFLEDVHLWIAFMSIPICIAIHLLIKNYSKLPWLSWIVFFSLGYFSVNVTIMKQSIAMAFVIFELLFLLKDKKKNAIICWIVACGFHPSALVCFIPIIIKVLNLRMNIKSGIVISVFSLALWNTSSLIVEYLFNYVKMDGLQRYSEHLSSFNMTLFMIFLLIFVFCLLIKKIYIDNINNNRKNQKLLEFNKDKNYDFLMWIYSISLPFLSLTSSFSDIYRVSLYFSIVDIILLPNMIIGVRNYLLRYSLFAIVISIMLYYASVRGLINVIPYKTFF